MLHVTKVTLELKIPEKGRDGDGAATKMGWPTRWRGCGTTTSTVTASLSIRRRSMCPLRPRIPLAASTTRNTTATWGDTIMMKMLELMMSEIRQEGSLPSESSNAFLETNYRGSLIPNRCSSAN